MNARVKVSWSRAQNEGMQLQIICNVKFRQVQADELSKSIDTFSQPCARLISASVE